MALVVLAVGLALVMPPATESIMGSLPPAKAGVGSAVNDTTRQIGGALGVAVLGSVMSSTYRPRVSEFFAQSPVPVPKEVVTAATDQVGAAFGVANQIGGPVGAQLRDVAGRAFVDGMSIAFLIGAAALGLGAVLVALYLPARAHDHDGPVGPAGPAGDGHDAHVPAGTPAPEPEDAPVPEPQDAPVPASAEVADPAPTRAST